MRIATENIRGKCLICKDKIIVGDRIIIVDKRYAHQTCYNNTAECCICGTAIIYHEETGTVNGELAHLDCKAVSEYSQ
jgi:hypothetical protein